MQAGTVATCSRCKAVLYRQSGVSLNGWIAIALATLVTFFIANYFPIVSLSVQGLTVNATLPHALLITWQQGHVLVAIMCGLFAMVFPLGQICFLLWALQSIATRTLPDDFRYGARVLHALVEWSMVPVLMLAILVALVKLSDMASVKIGPALWAFAALTVLMTIIGRMSALRLWHYAEDAALVPVSGANVSDPDTVLHCESCGYVQSALALRDKPVRCQRCAARVSERKPESMARTRAFVIAAAILYLPANILPVMQIRVPTGTSSHTILGGVHQLWQMGSSSLAAIVFIASVVVPLTKLLALTVLTLRRRWEGVPIQRQRTRMYELVVFIGQWSMLDVFVVIWLTSMADFPGISQVTAGHGAAAFGGVVILTMFAAMSYDPRIGWDQFTKNEPELVIKNDTLTGGKARHENLVI